MDSSRSMHACSHIIYAHTTLCKNQYLRNAYNKDHVLIIYLDMDLIFYPGIVVSEILD